MLDHSTILEVRDLTVTARGKLILDRVNLRLKRGEVLGILGASGSGKSTLLRALNRLLDLQTSYSVTGNIRFHGQDIYGKSVNPDILRQHIGMIFQQPAVFPITIERNVLFGITQSKKLNPSERAEVLEKSLREAALWDEVKDRLHDSALRLSIGQQQRLCIARSLALNPEIILMDEPTSALDTRATDAVERSILKMKAHRSVILVTHHLEQARRVTDWIACLCADKGHGELLESACCDAFFSSDACQKVFETLIPPEATSLHSSSLTNT
jgi:phosphate transport system ATP-binding protein